MQDVRWTLTLNDPYARHASCIGEASGKRIIELPSLKKHDLRQRRHDMYALRFLTMLQVFYLRVDFDKRSILRTAACLGAVTQY